MVTAVAGGTGAWLLALSPSPNLRRRALKVQRRGATRQEPC